MADRLASRRTTDDIATSLVLFGDDDDQLGADELLSNFVLFMGAGHETTTGLLVNGMYALVTHQDQLERVRRDRSLLPAAIEEMLRWENPVQRLRRTVAADFELHGERLQKGEAVELVPGAANRDPRRFDDPDRFQIERAPPATSASGRGFTSASARSSLASRWRSPSTRCSTDTPASSSKLGGRRAGSDRR